MIIEIIYGLRWSQTLRGFEPDPAVQDLMSALQRTCEAQKPNSFVPKLGTPKHAKTGDFFLGGGMIPHGYRKSVAGSQWQRFGPGHPPLPPGSQVQGLGKAFPVGIQRRGPRPASAQKQLLTAAEHCGASRKWWKAAAAAWFTCSKLWQFGIMTESFLVLGQWHNPYNASAPGLSFPRNYPISGWSNPRPTKSSSTRRSPSKA